MEDCYVRAQEYYSLIGNEAERARVIWLGKALRMSEGGYWIPRKAEHVIEKDWNARSMAMKYSCQRAFDMLRNACTLYNHVLEEEELEKYKLLKGWTTSDADWDPALKDREKEVKSDEWVGGLPSPIRKNLKEIREKQKKWLTPRELYAQGYHV